MTWEAATIAASVCAAAPESMASARPCDAVAHGRRPSRDEETRAGVQQHDVPMRASRAGQDAADNRGVRRGVSAAQIARRRLRQAEI